MQPPGPLRAFNTYALRQKLGFQPPSPLHDIERDIEPPPLQLRQDPREVSLGAANIETGCHDGNERWHTHSFSQV
jgi:hypothetical protein